MVKINGKVLHTNRKNGSLCTIGQLWDENRFKTFATVQRECNFNRPWYYYRSLISAIPDTWKFLLKTPDLVDSQMEKFEMVNGASSVSQQIYPDLIKRDVIMLQVCKTWNKKFNNEECVNITEMRHYFKNVRFISNSVKLRDFQYRLLHNKIFCKDILIHWKKVESNRCDFCKIEKQTILHLLGNCVKIKTLWNWLQALFRKEKIHTDFSLQNVIFNNVHTDVNHVANTTVLIGKQYIFRCKCQGDNPTYGGLKAEIILNYRIETWNSYVNSNITKVKRKWSPV